MSDTDVSTTRYQVYDSVIRRVNGGAPPSRGERTRLAGGRQRWRTRSCASAQRSDCVIIIASACAVRSAQLAMKYLSSVIDALTGSRSQRSGGVYSAVSTQEPSNPSCYSDPIYAPTTHPSGRSLNPAAAVFDRFLQGRLHQEKQRTKCEFEITSYVLVVLVS